MNLPLVTIIMPVFNTASFVGEAIRSVLSQTYSNWELIIVNDGSTDNSEEVIKSFVDSRVHYYRQKNMGVSSARNTGLQRMKGGFLCFLDSDDTLPEESISSRIRMFLDNPDTVFVDGIVEVYDNDTLKVLNRWKPSYKGVPEKKLMQLSEQCFRSFSWMIRILPDTTYKFSEDMKHGEDLFFLISIGGGGIYDHTTEVIYRYRVRSNSAMTNSEGLGRGYTQLYEKIRQNFSHKQSFEQRLYLLYRIRRIMVLTFLSEKKWNKAIKYLMTGTVD